MPIQIQDLRLSFAWFETNLALLEDVKSNAPYQFLGREWTYRQKFELGRKPNQDLSVPWPKPVGQQFWKLYLQKTPGDVDGEVAWHALVPLRGAPPFDISAHWLEGWISSEVFYYPYGIALNVAVRCLGSRSFEQAVETAFQVRNGAKFEVTWKEGVESLPLDAIAAAAFRRLRVVAFGQNPPAGTVSLTPLSFFTIVKATGDPNELVAASGDVQRYLEAVTSWRPTWRKDQLPDLSDAKVGIKQSAPTNHFVYGTQRGRAIWFPERFTAPDDGKHTLSCLHRNMTLASIQVESLCGLLAEVARRIAKGQILSQGIQKCTRSALDLLADFYAGQKSTYRSGSVRAQLERNDVIPIINSVRQYFEPGQPLKPAGVTT